MTHHGSQAEPRRLWLGGLGSDIIVGALLAALAATASYQSSATLTPLAFAAQANDIFFEADLSRVFRNMTKRESNHYRTKVHPLFSLAVYPPVFALRRGLGLDSVTAVRVVVAATAALWLPALYAVLRVSGLRRLDAVVFALLGGVTAAAVFWFTVPESYPLGSLTILIALGVAAVAERQKLREGWFTVASALTLTFTVTNWMTGLLLAAANLSWRRALQVSVNAFAIVALLWGVQRYVFPTAVFFLGDREEAQYVHLPEGGPLPRAQAFLLNAVLTPEIKTLPPKSGKPKLTVQFSRPGSGSAWGRVGTLLWGALLCVGGWGFVAHTGHQRMRFVLGVSVLGQFALHLVYGRETFLYSLHFVPLLVVLAAYGTFTRLRSAALIGAAVVGVCAGVNNVVQLRLALKLLAQLVPQ